MDGNVPPHPEKMTEAANKTIIKMTNIDNLSEHVLKSSPNLVFILHYY